MTRFELGDRHWTITVGGAVVHMVWGVKGKPDQRHDRKLASPEAAFAYRDMQIAKQREQGYVEYQPPAKEADTYEYAASPGERVEHAVEAPVSRSIRFERPAEKPTHFTRYPKPAWFLELEQRDRIVIEWSGELNPEDGEKAPRRETSYETIAEASEVYDEEVQTAREDNWLQVSSSRLPIFEREPALEAQCWGASPDDPAPWSVYADWLLERGDPLGELATSSSAAAKRRFDTELEELGIDHELVAIGRRYGFPRAATIRATAIDEADPTRLAFAARAVRTSGLGRFVDVLRFGLAGYTDKNDWAPVLRALAEVQPEQIRELYFDAYDSTDCEISWVPMGDLTGLFAPFAALEVLHLKSGGGGTLGELVIPKLHTFIRESGGLSAAELSSITSATWPALRHLEIWFGSSAYNADSSVASIRTILDGGLPTLRHLGIVNCEWVEDAIDALAVSKVLPQLDSLDLSRGIVSRRGAALLVEHAPRFRHLASLDLSLNQIEADEVLRIRDVLDNVIVADQRDVEPDYEQQEEDGERPRYVAVGE